MKRLIIVLVILLFAVPALAKEVSLTWDPSPTEGVAGYKICYSDISNLIQNQPVPDGVTCVDAGNTTSITINNLADDTPYYIGAVAYNGVNQDSVLSNIVLSPGFLIPDPPVNLDGSSTVNNIKVPF